MPENDGSETSASATARDLATALGLLREAHAGLENLENDAAEVMDNLAAARRHLDKVSIGLCLIVFGKAFEEEV